MGMFKGPQMALYLLPLQSFILIWNRRVHRKSSKQVRGKTAKRV